MGFVCYKASELSASSLWLIMFVGASWAELQRWVLYKVVSYRDGFI